MRRTLILLMLTGMTAQAAPSLQLRVSATVPPPACEYPRACEPVSTAVQTRVVIDNERILYLGSTPSVRRDGDLLTVNF